MYSLLLLVSSLSSPAAPGGGATRSCWRDSNSASTERTSSSCRSWNCRIARHHCSLLGVDGAARSVDDDGAADADASDDQDGEWGMTG